LTVLLSLPGYALLKGNDSDKAFTGGGDGNRAEYSLGGPSNTLRGYLIEGAGYFLDSYSDMLAFLKKVEVSELQGVDFGQLRDLVNNAVTHMENANTAYVNLKGLADSTPYNPDMIWELTHFNYNNFQRDNNLNKPIFKSLQDYLWWGDVRGAYNQMLADTVTIANVLYKIKAAVDAGNLPDASFMWEANQAYSESLLFGQYMAAVFSAILND
jgi:hypothetical protein